MVVRTQQNYFHAIYQLAAEVNSARTPKDALYLLAEITAKSMGAKGCSLMSLRPDGKRLLNISTYGLSNWYIRKGSVSTDNSIAQALEGQTVAVKKAAEDEKAQYRKQPRQEGIASIFSVPMMVRDKIIGVMRVYTAEPRVLTDDDEYFACAAANLGAIALENHKMYEDCQRSYKDCQKSKRECRQKTRWLGQILKEAAQGYEPKFEEEQNPPPERFPPELAGA